MIPKLYWLRERSIRLTLSLLLFYCPSSLSAIPLSLSIHAESAILMNAETGTILYEKKAHKLQYPASVTKVATAAYALKLAEGNLDTVITAEQDSVASITEEALKRSNYTLPAYWLIPGGTHIGIKRGEELALRDLLYGLMLASGNDAANVIAQHLGGSVPDFVSSMNAYLKEIGCKSTLFQNPHGLYHPKHQTTAYDVAIMMKEALTDPTFNKIISTVTYTRPKTNKQEASTLLQSNKMVRKGKFHYPKALGGKTGYLSIASHTLVVAASHEGRTLIAVLLKCKDREDIFKDAIKMFDTAFEQSKVQRTYLKAGPQKFVLVLDGASEPVKTYLKDDVSLEYYPAEEPQVKCLLVWTSTTPPIRRDQVVGELRLQTPDGKVLRTVSLLAHEDVSATWGWSLSHLFGCL